MPAPRVTLSKTTQNSDDPWPKVPSADTVQVVKALGRVDLPETLAKFVPWISSPTGDDKSVKCLATLGRLGGIQIDPAASELGERRKALLSYVSVESPEPLEQIDLADLVDPVRFFSSSWLMWIRHESKGKKSKGTFYFKIPPEVNGLGLLQRPNVVRLPDGTSETTEERDRVYMRAVAGTLEVLPILDQMWPPHALGAHLQSLAENRDRWIEIVDGLRDAQASEGSSPEAAKSWVDGS